MNDTLMIKPTPLLLFLRRPVLNEHAPGRLTLWPWLGWLCLLLLLGFAGGQVDGALIHLFGWRTPLNSAQNYLTTHASWSAAAVVLAAPILEELGFRAFLSTAPKSVFIGLTLFLSYVYFAVHMNMAHVPAALAIAHYFAALWPLLPAGIISLLLYRYAREQVLTLFRRHSAWVFWVSCIVFGAAHAAVYSNHLEWWGFVLALPQFLIGVGLAYVRVAFGLRWSIATHLAFDALVVFASWLYVATPHASTLRTALPGLFLVLVALIVAYGLVVVWRVLRRQW